MRCIGSGTTTQLRGQWPGVARTAADVCGTTPGGIFGRSVLVRDGIMEVQMQGWDVDDNVALQWCQWAKRHIPSYLEYLDSRVDGVLTFREVNISNNAIGDHGMHALLRAFKALGAGIQVLKVFRNNLGRAGACALADWVATAPSPLWELHLSHNFVPREGALAICGALAQSRAYPAKQVPGRVPLWLRLEGNLIEDPTELVTLVRARMQALRGAEAALGELVCCVENREFSVCSNKSCAHASEKACPVLHITYASRQQRGDADVPPEARAWSEKWSPLQEAARWSLAAEDPEPQQLLPLSSAWLRRREMEAEAQAWPAHRQGQHGRQAGWQRPEAGRRPVQPEAQAEVQEEAEEEVLYCRAQREEALKNPRGDSSTEEGGSPPGERDSSSEEGEGTEQLRRLELLQLETAKPPPARLNLEFMTRRPFISKDKDPWEHGIFLEDPAPSADGRRQQRQQQQQQQRLMRTPVGDGRVFGLLTKWMGMRGSFGWINAEERIRHHAAHKHHGQIFLWSGDAEKGLEAGSRVSFLLYEDSDGLGAQDCRLVPAALEE